MNTWRSLGWVSYQRVISHVKDRGCGLMDAFLRGRWFQEQRQLTHENVQRKQARTGEEREEEEEEQLSESESEDEDNEIIYNPKNLPLGWDGKVGPRSRSTLCLANRLCVCWLFYPPQPIPYWLYKLHGLNINYNCEICGNYNYRGPKAFQRHFAVSWSKTPSPCGDPLTDLAPLIQQLNCVFCAFCRSGGTLTACAAWESQTRLTSPTSRRSRTPWRVSWLYGVTFVRQRSSSELLCVCFSSVGKAEVSEGAGAVAARHRGECVLWVGSAAAETRPRGHTLMWTHVCVCVCFRRSTRTPAATWSTRRPTRIWRDRACCRGRRASGCIFLSPPRSFYLYSVILFYSPSPLFLTV